MSSLATLWPRPKLSRPGQWLRYLAAMVSVCERYLIKRACGVIFMTVGDRGDYAPTLIFRGGNYPHCFPGSAAYGKGIKMRSWLLKADIFKVSATCNCTCTRECVVKMLKKKPTRKLWKPHTLYCMFTVQRYSTCAHL